MDNTIIWGWQGEFDERQLKEIAFSRVYAKEFGHGTDGHNGKLIIAKMADLLTVQEKRLTQLQEELLSMGDKG